MQASNENFEIACPLLNFFHNKEFFCGLHFFKRVGFKDVYYLVLVLGIAHYS